MTVLITKVKPPQIGLIIPVNRTEKRRCTPLRDEL